MKEWIEEEEHGKRAKNSRLVLPDRQRLLPQSEDAELGLLSSMLIDPVEVIDEARGMVATDAFQFPRFKTIFEQLLAMSDEHKPIDFIQLTQWLRDRDLLEACGGASFISELHTFQPTARNWRSYADTINEKHTLRSVIDVCGDFGGRAYDEQDRPRELVDELVTKLLEIQASRSEEETVRPISKFAAQALAEIEFAYNQRGGVIGIPTGFVDLDRMIGGWQRGYLYYIGARPAMGKTSIGLNFAAETAASANAEGCPALFFSIEMTGVQLAKRLICMKGEINLQRARDGFLSKERDFQKLERAIQHVGHLRMDVDETASLTITAFRTRVRRWLKKIRRARKGPPPEGKPEGIVFLDFLQRMKGSSKRADDSRYLELQEISNGLAELAKETQLPHVVLAQLKRPKDRKPDSEPDMSEFRECGDIEQDAHVVALLHRPHYYVKHSTEKQDALCEAMLPRFQEMAYWRAKNAGKDEGICAITRDSVQFNREDLARYAKLLIDKQREGPVGPIDLRFIADYTQFETWDRDTQLFSNNPERRQAPAASEDDV